MIIAGGGTGGHVNPAVAIANAAKERYNEPKILFIGTKSGMESILVPKEGYDLKFIDVEGFLRKKSFYNVIVLTKFFKSIIKSILILKKFKPDIVVGTGGYVSAPVVIGAYLLKIPTVIHEQNAIAGKTTKLLSKYADKICVAFNNKNLLGYPEKTIVTGNPIRSTFLNMDYSKSRKLLGFDDEIPFVLCVSGSLGSQKICEVMTELIKDIYKEKKYRFLIVTGDLYYEDVLDELKNSGIDLKNSFIYIKNYLHDIEKYIAAADLVISRAGALFLSEISYLGKASILIPSPNVAENHQEKNADYYVNGGCAVKIPEKDLDKTVIGNVIENLIKDINKIRKMERNSLKLSINSADKKILDVIDTLI